MDMMTDAATFGEEPEDSEAMPDEELLAVLAAHEAQAIGYEPGGDDEISSQQDKALNYYYGDMDDLPAQEGSSSVVDRTVQVVVDNALASLLKPFVSSDETVMFAPRGPEDVEFAEQATEYVNYVFNCDNPGFVILHDWFKDALLSKLGVVKASWEDQSRTEMEQVPIADEMQAAVIRMNPAYAGEEDGIAFLEKQVEDGRVKVVNIPPEEFRVSPFSRSGEIPIYSAHVPANVIRSDLVSLGFDPELVASLPSDNSTYTDNVLRQTRYQDENFTDGGEVAPHSSQEKMDLRDEYVRVDYDGDGVAELRRVLRVGDTILLNEELDREEYPFPMICPVPMPHKLFGLSLADLAIEDQKINTALWRQMLDNLYKANNPRPVVAEDGERTDGATADSLNDPAPGAAVLVKSLAGFRYDAVPYTADSSLPMLEMVRNRVEEKTGVSLTGQGLDTNALRKSGQMTATEMAMIQTGKNARVEMMARIFAETGVKSLFKLILHLVSKYQPKERMIRLRNQWVEMDPRGWPEMDVEISVGLGIGDKSEQIDIADGILMMQERIAQSPFAQMVGPENVFNAARKKLNASGVKNVEEYLGDPSQMEPQQEEGPSPEEMQMQAEMQMQQAKLQGEQELAAMKLQLQSQESQQKMELERQKAEFEAAQAEAKMAFEMRMAEMKFEFEQQLAARRQVASEAQSELSSNRSGGDLDK